MFVIITSALLSTLSLFISPLFLGVKPEDTFRYFYLAYIPAAIGVVETTLLFTKENISYIVSLEGIEGIVIAFIIALITGLIIIDLLLKFAKRRNIYIVDFVLGAITIIISSLTLL